jgi:DNA replication protein DnaC
MKKEISQTMINATELWRHFKLLHPTESLSKEETGLLERFLGEEYRLRELKRVGRLMKRSGIQRLKLLTEFDWTFNPKIPRDKLMEFVNTEWLKKPSNLVIIGPAGTGKTHVASALCHDAVTRGYPTIFISLFDLTAKIAKARNLYSLIDSYAKVPVLCLDELGYVIPTKEQADSLFQILSKRTEVVTTIVTTNLVPSQWGKIFDTGTASAILDRLSMNGRFITFEGRSYRSKR